jgi:hypothetical protein
MRRGGLAVKSLQAGRHLDRKERSTNLFDEPTLTRVLGEATFTKDRAFVLSALTSRDLSETIEILNILWTTREDQREFAHKLRTCSFSFPWSERPAHTLFVSAIEQWAPNALEKMLCEALQEPGGAQAATSNAHLATVLVGLSDPGNLGTIEFVQKHRFQDTTKGLRSLIRAYVLDPVSEAPERRKLGLERTLTTQDRYELLTCIWRCQQGLAKDPSPQKHTRLWVLIDHAESMIDYPPAERKLLTNGLLTILSQMQLHFTLWLNIAEMDDERIAEVKKACGASVLEYLNFDLTNLAAA